jgi:small subunit ribosomal protein S2
MPVRFLIPREKYLAAGVHIGTQQRTKQMQRFVYKIRPIGLAVLNLRIVDERIRVAGKFLAKAENIVVVSRKSVAHSAIKKFAEIVDAKAVCGRFMPGMLTNPNYEGFYEADVVFIVDPFADYQAVEESVRARVPLVSICDTFNETNDLDLIIPANNKGRKSLATLFWLLAREVLKNRGKIKTDREFKYSIEDFYGEEKQKYGEDRGSRRKRKVRRK